MTKITVACWIYELCIKIDRPPILAACQPIMAQCGKNAFSWIGQKVPYKLSEIGRAEKEWQSLSLTVLTTTKLPFPERFAILFA